jgi:hypothetical protein
MFRVLIEYFSIILVFCQFPEYRNYSMVKPKIKIKQPRLAETFDKTEGRKFHPNNHFFSFTLLFQFLSHLSVLSVLWMYSPQLLPLSHNLAIFDFLLASAPPIAYTYGAAQLRSCSHCTSRSHRSISTAVISLLLLSVLFTSPNYFKSLALKVINFKF